MRLVRNRRTGQVFYVDDEGFPALTEFVNPGVGSVARARDIASRLPDAELHGYYGHGVVTPRRSRAEQTAEETGRTNITGSGLDARDHTIRPLSSQDQNARGNTVEVPPPTIGAAGELIETGFRSLVEMRSKGPDAELINVSLDLSLAGGIDNDVLPSPTDPFAGNFPFVRCLLEWGIGGGQFSAQCDWMQGTQLSVPANFIRVAAQYLVFGGAVAAPNNVPATFRVSAGLSYGNIGRTSSPSRFTDIFPETTVLAVGGNITRKIPKYATSFTVVATSPCTIEILPWVNAVARPVYTFTPPMTNVGQYNVDNAFPLYNGARWIRVTNTGPIENRFGIIYSLAL